MRLGRRVAKVMIWGLVLIGLILAAGGWFAYALLTDGDTAARLIKAQAARFLPRSIVDMGRVNVGLFRGDVTVTHVLVRQMIDGQPFPAASIPWMSVKLDARQLLHGRLEPREVVVIQPTLRLCRRADGTWNLQGLIAEPWPAATLESQPPIVIRDGKVELIGFDGADAMLAGPLSAAPGLGRGARAGDRCRGDPSPGRVAVSKRGRDRSGAVIVGFARGASGDLARRLIANRGCQRGAVARRRHGPG